VQWLIVGGSSVDTLVHLLASLAAETPDDMTHEDMTHQDDDDDGFVQSQHVLPLSAEDERKIAEETLEMSQRVWDDEDLRTDTAAVDTAAATDDDDDDM